MEKLDKRFATMDAKIDKQNAKLWWILGGITFNAIGFAVSLLLLLIRARVIG